MKEHEKKTFRPPGIIGYSFSKMVKGISFWNRLATDSATNKKKITDTIKLTFEQYKKLREE